MKIVTIDGARVLDLVPTEEFRSPEGVYLPQFVSAIAARYAFLNVPKDFAETMKSGAKFETGRFFTDEKEFAIKELAIYADGIICDAYHSKYADFVLDDLAVWAKETFGLKERISPTRRTYTSAIVCIFDRAVESGLGKLSGLCEMLSRALNEANGWNYQYNLFRLGFNVDPKAIPHLRSTNFLLERRAQADYSENRYFSVAPLKTDAHIELLRRLETELLT
jgi:hypothetical protein